MTPTAPALLATVCANPGDTHARMVYADALHDAGDEEGAHLQRAIAEPHNDGHRLALADALERTEGDVECEKCVDGMRWIGPGNIVECRQCSGAGRVSDGRKEWSEFIRVQCELAARDDERCRCRECQPTGQHTNGPCRSPLKPLRRRERELWPAVRGRFEGYGVEPCYQTGLMVHQPPDGEIVQRSTVLIQRGLPAVVRCTLTEWMGERCERCQGRGHRTIYGDGSGPWAKCQYCVDGLTHGIGPRLAQRWPVVAVEVADIEDFGFDADSMWIAGTNLPEQLKQKLPGTEVFPTDDGLSFDDWLSDAVIEWARGQAIEDTK